MRNNIPEYSVAELSRNLKTLIEDNFGYVKIRGEISGFKKATSGHCYFSLKDEEALISAVYFKNRAMLTDVKIEDGLEIFAYGKITTYQGRSNYQIIIDKIEIAGIGALMAMIEERRKKLSAEGLFDPKYKKPLPFWPKKIGIITSPTGAVIEDIIHRITDRFPTNLLIYPSLMQGNNAAENVIMGIKYFNQAQRPDLIIIARGGGSFEDLLPFNDENLVREIFKSEIPIISAIGHETDVTLADYVSDLRAPTPSAAAEIATPVLREFEDKISNLEKRIINYCLNFLNNKQNILDSLGKRIIHPKSFLDRLERNCLKLEKDLKNNILSRLLEKEKRVLITTKNLPKPNDKIANLQKKLDFIAKNLAQTINSEIRKLESKLEYSGKLLTSYHYKQVLQRGYALIKDADNNSLIKGSKNLENGKRINIEMFDGSLNATIKSI